MDLIFSGKLFINGIYELEIHQNLLGVPDATVEDIRKVTSHPQALSQCHDYIKMRGFEAEEANNTALAAKTVAEANDKSLGAIASVETAEIYVLKVIEANINKSGENTTRFAVFSRTPKSNSPRDSRFILLFTVKNEAGSLGQAISVIGSHGFNLRALKSRPARDLIWSYYFYAEGEGNIASDDGKKMLEELRTCCDQVRIIASFEKEIVL
jgi:chorismate mutase/prephenate dehydratase